MYSSPFSIRPVAAIRAVGSDWPPAAALERFATLLAGSGIQTQQPRMQCPVVAVDKNRGTIRTEFDPFRRTVQGMA